MRLAIAILALAPLASCTNAADEGRSVFSSNIVLSPSRWVEPEELITRLNPIISDLKSQGFDVAVNPRDASHLVEAVSEEGERRRGLGGTRSSVKVRRIEFGGMFAYEVSFSALVWSKWGKNPWYEASNVANEMTNWQTRILSAAETKVTK